MHACLQIRRKLEQFHFALQSGLWEEPSYQGRFSLVRLIFFLCGFFFFFCIGIIHFFFFKKILENSSIVNIDKKQPVLPCEPAKRQGRRRGTGHPSRGSSGCIRKRCLWWGHRALRVAHTVTGKICRHTSTRTLGSLSTLLYTAQNILSQRRKKKLARLGKVYTPNTF